MLYVEDISSQCDQGVTDVLLFQNIISVHVLNQSGVVQLLVIKNYTCTIVNEAVYMYA